MAAYYQPFSLQDREGNTYEFHSELDTSEAPRFSLTVSIQKNGIPEARRTWQGMVPLLGMVRMFATKYVENPTMQRRYRIGLEAPAEEADPDQQRTS